MRKFERLACVLAAFFLAPFGVCFAEASSDPLPAPSESEKQFLDRLMLAESGGRLYAKNPATSGYGPFQFLSETFLDVVRRSFPELAAGKSDAEILKLRASMEVARNAALIYTRENAAFLAAHGTPITAANLRLAFFVGPGGAIKVLTAKPEEALVNILSAAAIAANPILGRMTAAGLIDRSSREAEGVGSGFTAASSKAARPKVDVRCNLKLASCRKWLALAERRMGMRHVVLGSEAKQP